MREIDYQLPNYQWAVKLKCHLCLKYTGFEHKIGVENAEILAENWWQRFFKLCILKSIIFRIKFPAQEACTSNFFKKFEQYVSMKSLED